MTNIAIRRAKSHPWQLLRIPTRNSWERRRLHTEAEQNGVEHRSIINYFYTHVNTDREAHEVCGCDRQNCYAGMFHATISLTAYSFVELNNGDTETLLGDEDTFENFRTASVNSDRHLQKSIQQALPREHWLLQRDVHSKTVLGAFVSPMELVVMCLGYAFEDKDVENYLLHRENWIRSLSPKSKRK